MSHKESSYSLTTLLGINNKPCKEEQKEQRGDMAKFPIITNSPKIEPFFKGNSNIERLISSEILSYHEEKNKEPSSE